MLMYSFKTVKITYNNYFKIYDIKGRILKISSGILLLLLLSAIFEPADAEYMTILAKKHALASVDNIYDYFVPIISCFIIAYAFFNDYKNNTHELISFYNHYKFNYIVLFRWFIYTIIFIIGSFITGLIYYREISFLDIQNIILSLRFIPNIIMLNSLMLTIITITKNIYAGIFISTAYAFCDYLSSAHIFKILSLGANANNFYYSVSPKYYIINRLILLAVGMINIYIAGKASSK